MRSKVLISKDALCRAYLPLYGNEYWQGQTPNMDEIAAKGTIYTNYYTAAPSSAMAYLSMFTGKYPYELDIETYRPIKRQYTGVTVFDKAHEMGYKCHVLWDEAWLKTAKRYSECYGNHTVFHNMGNIRQGVGSHYIHKGLLQNNTALVNETLGRIENEIDGIFTKNDKIFLWIHLPHVLNGNVSYGSDIDTFDQCIGIIRKYVDDEDIVITADHGNMNGHQGKLCYGFDLHDSAIRIPLITCRKENLSVCTRNLSSVDTYDLLFTDVLPTQREFIYADSAYYVQRHRKLAVIYGKYKYIYCNKSKKEELYDVEYDPNENFSMMDDYVHDVDRKVMSPARELYFYPQWDSLPDIRHILRAEKDRIWRRPTAKQKMMNETKDCIRPIYATLKKAYHSKILVRGK